MKRSNGGNDLASKKPRLIGGDSSNGGNADYEGLQQQRHNLPIFNAKKRLVQEIKILSSAIVIGETGSGKTTQIPQFLYEAGIHKNHVIACTQPRRVAAITVAQRVAAEKGCHIGHLVGYSVRFDDVTSSDTKIKYMTDGMLLREAILDPLLRKYSVVILDEAHERTIQTDVLFGVVKAAQRDRKRGGLLWLKIIVMSATMDVDHFSQYFSQAPVLYIEGRQHTVEILYTRETQSDYLFASLVTVFQIHKQAPPNHDILVFVTGQEEIESVVKSIKDIARDLQTDLPKLLVLPLYASLAHAQQLRVFSTTPKGVRKVIVSTNIAETSVTIHGIKYIVDTGKVKAKSFKPSTGLDMLKVQWISKAQAWQRTGRAGRESTGTCYRLYSEAQFESLDMNTVPEIQRCNMSSVALQLLAMGVSDIVNFDFMDKPSKESILKALEELMLLGAIENDIEKPKLTELGRTMAAFPLDPRLAKTLLAAKDHNCLEEILTVVSLLFVETVVHSPNNKKELAAAAHQKFLSSDGDHVTLLNIYRAYKGVNGNKDWCHENFVNMRNMKNAMDVRRQLHEICVKQKLPLKSCGRDTTAIRKCLTVGFFMNTAELQKEGQYISLASRKGVAIHPSSCLFQHKPAYVIYSELVQTSKCYMRLVCVVDAEWLYDVAPEYFRKKRLSHTK